MVLFKHFKVAPLSSSFFMTSIIGLLISLVYFDKFPDFAFTFIILFFAMFLASLISMAKAPVEAQVALDHHMKKSKKKK